ncbi:MAG: Hpt domain-containing protein, partial [Magnetococcales bacterium]|nr:Hpt domain-containing protein [Magnetococcales bacterium]
MRLEETFGKLRRRFVERAAKRIANLHGLAVRLPRGNVDPLSLNTLFIHAHGLVGTAATFGFQGLSVAAQRLANAIHDKIQSRSTISREARDKLVKSIDALQEMAA